MRGVTLIAVLGVGSRYSWLAASQLVQLEHDFDVTVDWWPVYSPDLIREAQGGTSPFENPEPQGQYDPQYRHRDAARWARLLGLTYDPVDMGQPDFHALAVNCWDQDADPEQRRSRVLNLFREVFEHGRVPAAHKIDKFARERHDKAVVQALEMGVFGVPSFAIDSSIYWGQDRLPLVRDHLRRGCDV